MIREKKVYFAKKEKGNDVTTATDSTNDWVYQVDRHLSADDYHPEDDVAALYLDSGEFCIAPCFLFRQSRWYFMAPFQPNTPLFFLTTFDYLKLCGPLRSISIVMTVPVTFALSLAPAYRACAGLAISFTAGKSFIGISSFYYYFFVTISCLGSLLMFLMQHISFWFFFFPCKEIFCRLNVVDQNGHTCLAFMDVERVPRITGFRK